jgi:uncharacterized membrane protein YoaK (UPF0700 family)
MASPEALVDKWLTFGLAFVGGYGDAAGLVLAGTFTGHVTGNLVLVAVSIAMQDWRATLGHLSAIVTFLVGVFLSVFIGHLLRAWPSWSFLPSIMAIEVILIGGASWAMSSHAALGVAIFVVCVSLALGLQNGSFRSAGGISVHTTFLTGMITRLIATEADKLTSDARARATAPADPKVILLAGIWASFLIGAVAGAAMAFRFKALGILGAAVILVAIIGRCCFAARRESSGS